MTAHEHESCKKSMKAIENKIERNLMSIVEKRKLRSDLWKSYKWQNKLVKALKSQVKVENKKYRRISTKVQNKLVKALKSELSFAKQKLNRLKLAVNNV
jgi:predicted  nucleic acid-binding Zn-ribbon protein